LKGKDVSCVDFDGKGNAWIGLGSKLLRYHSGEIEEFEVGSSIADISIGDNGTIWLVTKDKGLAKF